MDITNIKIKNIKGYGDPGLDWNLSQTPIINYVDARIQQASAKLRNVFVKALLWC